MNGERKMDKLLEVLKSVRKDVDFENETALIDDGILDSFDVVAIVSEINMEFDIEITVDDMTPENFNSMEAMNDMINRILDEE